MKPYYWIILLIYMTSWSQKWPSNEFAIKYNYLEVVGDTIGIDQKQLIKPKFAMYPNGKEGINSLIKNKIKYPNTNENPKNNGRVILGYVVEKNGEIVEIEILESAGKPFDDEAIRVLKKMERWIPGINNGQIVRTSYKQPFKFQ